MTNPVHGRPIQTAPARKALTALAAGFPSSTTIVIDGEIVDLVAVGRCLDGERLPLHPAEAAFAVAYGTARLGMSAEEIAALLGVDKRTVVRYRIKLGVAADAQ